VDTVYKWITAGQSSSMIIGINGKHGSGTTTCLFSVALALSQMTSTEDMYVVDDIDKFGVTDLSKALYGHDRLILLIDDADKQQALRPIRLAMHSLPICAIYTSSNTPYSEDMAALNESESVPEIVLNSTPDTIQLKALRSLLKRPHLSISEKEALARANFRSAVRILEGRSTTKGVTRRLVNLRRDGHIAAARAVEYLTFTTARDLLIPQSLMRRAMGREIPTEVMSWVQIRPYLRRLRQADHLLWIEDREAAKRAEAQWRSASQYDERSFNDSILLLTESLVTAASVDSAVDRTFIRRLLGHLPYELRENVARSHIAVLRQMAEREQGQDLAFGWLSYLKLGGVDVSHFVASKIALGFGTLDDGVDLVLAIQAMGGEYAARELAVKVDGASLWSAHAWVNFISLLEHFPRSQASKLLRAAIPWLRARSDLTQILDTWNTLQTLLRLVELHGSPSDRIHVHSYSLPFMALRPNVANAVFKLTTRCIVQSRSALAIRALQAAISTDAAQRSKMLAIFRDEAIGLTIEEREQSLAQKALDCVVYNHSWPPSVQNQLRRSALAFASKWSPDLVPSLIYDNATYLSAALVESPFNHSAHLHSYVMRVMAERGALVGEYMPVALAPFSVPKSNPSVGRSAISSLLAFSASTSLYSFQARSALYQLIDVEPELAMASVEAFLDDVRDLVAERGTLHVPTAFSDLDTRSGLPLVQDLLFAIRYVGGDERALVRSAVKRWNQFPSLRTWLAGEVLRLNMQDEAQDLFRDGEGGGLSWTCMVVSAMANMRNLPAARAGIREIVNHLQRHGEGAHPFAITRAAASMSHVTDGNESELYSLVTRLMTLKPL
jgi:hypothetical protein